MFKLLVVVVLGVEGIVDISTVDADSVVVGTLDAAVVEVTGQSACQRTMT